MSLGSSLEALYLDDCPLVCAGKGAALLNPDGLPTVDDRVNAKAGTLSWTYYEPWSYHLRRLAISLLKLRRFVMGYGRLSQDKAALSSSTRTWTLRNSIYINTYTMIAPTIHFAGIGTGLVRNWPKCEEKDDAELRKLWSLTERRRRLGTTDSFGCSAVP